MTRAASLLDEIRAEPWAIEPERLAALARAAAAEPTAALHRAEPGGASAPYELRGSTAVVPIQGVLVRRASLFDRLFGMHVTSTPQIRAAVEAAAADPRVKTIALHVDSPGGEAAGVLEAGETIREARARKRVEAVVEGRAASGAYWLAAQAHAITAAPDALVGSIGVYQVVVDESKAAERDGVSVHVVRSGEYKGVGVAGAPVTEAQLGEVRRVVDGFAALFNGAVARGRGRELETVQTWADGRIWLAAEAQALGLIDRTEPAAKAFARLAPTPQEGPMAENMSEDPKALAKAAAEAERKRFVDLKAAFPQDLDYATNAYEAGQSLLEAKAAYADVLQARLAEQGKAAAAALEAAKAVRPAGTAPISRGNAEPASTPTGGQDFVTASRALATERKIPLARAMSEIARTSPDLYKAYKAQMRERAVVVHERKTALGMA